MFIVTPLNAVVQIVEREAASHVLGLLGTGAPHPDVPGIAAGNHLKLIFNDIPEPTEGLIPPDTSHVIEILNFIDGWDRTSPMLVHCWAGISRSTAAAFIGLCHLNPERSEAELAGLLRAASPVATPNPFLVRLADDHMQRGGAMNAAVAAIGRGTMAWQGNIFKLPARIGA